MLTFECILFCFVYNWKIKKTQSKSLDSYVWMVLDCNMWHNITTRNHGSFDYKSKPKKNHFDIWFWFDDLIILNKSIWTHPTWWWFFIDHKIVLTSQIGQKNWVPNKNKIKSSSFLI
jgi:hypothetical protein